MMSLVPLPGRPFDAGLNRTGIRSLTATLSPSLLFNGHTDGSVADEPNAPEGASILHRTQQYVSKASLCNHEAYSSAR